MSRLTDDMHAKAATLETLASGFRMTGDREMAHDCNAAAVDLVNAATRLARVEERLSTTDTGDRI